MKKPENSQIIFLLAMVFASFTLMLCGIFFSFQSALNGGGKLGAASYNVTTTVSTDGVLWQPSSNALDFDGIDAAHPRVIRVRLVNNDNYAYDISLRIRSPLGMHGSEIPAASGDGTFYYLGAAIRIGSVTTGYGDSETLLDPPSPVLDRQLVATPDQTPFAADEITDIPDLYVVSSHRLPAYATTYFTVTFEYAHVITVQPPAGAKCTRAITLAFNDND